MLLKVCSALLCRDCTNTNPWPFTSIMRTFSACSGKHRRIQTVEHKHRSILIMKTHACMHPSHDSFQKTEPLRNVIMWQYVNMIMKYGIENLLYLSMCMWAYPRDSVQQHILYVFCFWLLDYESSLSFFHQPLQGWVQEVGMVDLERHIKEEDNDVEELLNHHYYGKLYY